MKELEVQRNKKSFNRLLISTPIALFLITRSLVNNLNSDRDGKVLIVTLLIVFGLLCTFFLINAIVQILKKDPALVISDAGIIDNINLSHAGLIEWKNISDCSIVKFTGTPHLVITLKDYSDVMSKVDGVKKKLTEVKVRELGTPVAINVNLLKFDVHELVKVIHEKMVIANGDNSNWFDDYTNEIDKTPTGGYKIFDKFFLCPCCHFPTLSERQSFNICLLCNWEDDGQDDHNADLVLGGPNQDYSLTEARENFKSYLTKYRPSDKHHFERTTLKKTFDGKIILDFKPIKNQLIHKYNLAMNSSDLAERQQLFSEITELENKLI